jgi:hypothetical protein
MNTNIVAYLIEITGMTQTDIASKLKSADKDTFGVSQALVSKWNRGEKIPKDREIEMLKLADLFWELELVDDEVPWGNIVDSRWNIIVKSIKNQEDWYNFFKDMLAPKQFINVNSKYKDSDFVKFVRECIFALNDAGFKVPENPESIKKNTSSRFFDFFKFWMHRITILQYWCPNSIPHKHEDFEFEKLYNNLPRIALAQVALDDIDVPEQTNGVLLRNFTEDLNQFVKSTIEGYHQWEVHVGENFFGDDSFNELLIYPKNDNKDELSQSSSQIESNESESIDDRYLSYAERKIMDRLNANEKLIRELHQKIDSLIDQNNKGD